MCFGGSSVQTINEPAVTPPPSQDQLDMQKLTTDFAKYIYPSATDAVDIANQGLLNQQVQPDYQQMYGTEQQNIGNLMGEWQDVQSGQVPQALQDARLAAMQYGINKSIGSSINSLANRGVLDSSVAKNAMSDIGSNATSQINAGYSNDLATASQLLNQGLTMAQAPISTAAAAQEASINAPMKYYSMATGTEAPATDAWKTMLAANTALKSTPETVVTQQPNILSPLISGASSLLSAKGDACFVAGTKVSVSDCETEPIENILTDDLILAGNTKGPRLEPASVKKSLCTGHQKVVTISTAKRKVTCSKPQRFFVMEPDGTVCRLPADMLHIGLDVLTIEGPEPIEGVKFWINEEIVYDIDIDTRGNQFYAEGFLVEGMEGGERQWE